MSWISASHSWPGIRSKCAVSASRRPSKARKGTDSRAEQTPSSNTMSADAPSWAANCRTSAVLPVPAAPLTSTQVGLPARTCS